MKQALIVYGGWAGHDPEGVAKVFEEILKEEGFGVVLSDTLDTLVEDLSGYDLIVPVWTMGTLPPKAEQNLCDAVAKGAGLAGCHGGMCDAFRNQTTYQFMTGAQWVAHPGNSTVTYEVKLLEGEELNAGLDSFCVTSEQYYIHVDPAVHVLATTEFTYPGPHMANGVATLPVAFTKKWGEGKVYYNSLGHSAAVFAIPEAKEMMRRGFLWATR